MKARGSGVLDIKDQTILWNSSEVKGLRTVNKVQSKQWIKESQTHHNISTAISLHETQILLRWNEVTWVSEEILMWFAQISKVRDFRMNSKSFLHVVAHSNFCLLFNNEIILYTKQKQYHCNVYRQEFNCLHVTERISVSLNPPPSGESEMVIWPRVRSPTDTNGFGLHS